VNIDYIATGKIKLTFFEKRPKLGLGPKTSHSPPPNLYYLR